MKKIIILLLLVTTPLIFAAPAYAAEITPTDGSYGYGSSSEFSGSQATGDGADPAPASSSSSSGNLANTGDHLSLTTIAIDIVAVLCIGSVVYVAYRSRQKRRYIRSR